MKIGILTQPLHHNYGGILQSWALQQILKRLGHEPEMIFLVGERPHGKLLVKRCLSFIKCLIKKYLFFLPGIYIHPVLYPYYKPSRPLFVDTEFVDRIIKTKFLTTDINLTKYVRKRGYDAFIVGSDQVWREEYSPNIMSFFLDFLPEDDCRKRIAYAASFGKEREYISKGKMPECRRLLKRFTSVSVREDRGISIVSTDFGYPHVVKVLDPTLLISVLDYERLIEPKDRSDTRYIATYMLDRSKDKRTIAEYVSADRSKNVREIYLDAEQTGRETVSQWLANFADADFVVTDSFHGCVFSIIFEKPFIAIANAERGLDRFVSLLGEFGLSYRLVSSSEDYSSRRQQLLSAPDYESVRARLDILRRNSLKFLTGALAE